VLLGSFRRRAQPSGEAELGGGQDSAHHNSQTRPFGAALVL